MNGQFLMASIMLKTIFGMKSAYNLCKNRYGYATLWRDHFGAARFVVAHFVAGPYWSGPFWHEFHKNIFFFFLFQFFNL